ncbi:acyl carrier protein [Phytohabitans flavus]|uniref:acyl carrier protein n=1 Tax=Phytohabitans flavus TaxID=1076124 RepID=UPI00363F5A33
MERWLRRLISDLTAQTLNMPVAEVTPNKPLSSLGLDSIVGVELINRLNAALDITLKTIVIFDHPTVADLTAFVLGRHGEQVAAHAAAAAPAPPPSPLAPAAPLPTAAAPPAPSRVAAAPALAASAGLRAVRFTRPGSPRDLSIAPIEPAAPDPARSRSRSGRFRSTSRTSCWPMACTRSCRTTRSPRAWRCPAWWAGSAQG